MFNSVLVLAVYWYRTERVTVLSYSAAATNGTAVKGTGCFGTQAPGSIPSTHRTVHNHHHFQLQDKVSMPLPDLTYQACTRLQTLMQATTRTHLHAHMHTHTYN